MFFSTYFVCVCILRFSFSSTYLLLPPCSLIHTFESQIVNWKPWGPSLGAVGKAWTNKCSGTDSSPGLPLCKSMPTIRSVPSSPLPGLLNCWEHNWVMAFFNCDLKPKLWLWILFQMAEYYLGNSLKELIAFWNSMVHLQPLSFKHLDYEIKKGTGSLLALWCNAFQWFPDYFKHSLHCLCIERLASVNLPHWTIFSFLICL